MTFSDSNQQYEKAMEFWLAQGDQAKLSILEDLKENEWSIEYMVAQYGQRYEPIPMSFLKQEYKRLTLSPVRLDAKLQENLNATPLKNTLRRLSEQCLVQEALAELIDNVFDNFARKQSTLHQSDLTIAVHFLPALGGGYEEIILQENSGGIEKDELTPLVRLGETATAGATTIGAWGQGSKIACFAIASETEVFTCPPNKDPVCVYFPYGWLIEDHALYMNWDVGVYQAEGVNEGQTIFRFRQLQRQAREADVLSIKEYLEKIYSYKLRRLREAGISVSVVLEDLGEDVSYELQPTFTFDQLEEKYGFSWLPDYGPTRVRQTLTYEDPRDTERQRKLDITVVAGILHVSSATLGGVHMFGNGRLFTPQPEQGANVVFGVNVQGRQGKIRSYGPPLYRLVAFVFFEGEEGQSQFVPWAAPLKNRYNRNNQFHEQLVQLMYSVLYPYSLVCESCTPDQSRFFTQRWLDSSDEEKRKSLVNYFDELDKNLIEGIISHHTFDTDLDALPEYDAEAIGESAGAPFGFALSRTVKKFLQKLNDDKYDVDSTDFFISFFTRTSNELVAENNLITEETKDQQRLQVLLDEPPAPDHLNIEYMKGREQEARRRFEAGNLSVEPQEKEQLIKVLGLTETATVGDIAEALKAHVLETLETTS